MARYKFVTSGSYIEFKDGDTVVKTMHNTSRDVEWSYDSTGGMIWEIQGTKFQTDDISNIEFDGVACNSQDDFQTGIEAMFTGYAGGSSVVGYPAGTKIYMALLTQSGTDAPVATVLQNDLGGTVVWARTGVGVYTATLAGAFTENKTFLPNVSILTDSGIPSGSIIVSRFSPNIIKLESFNNAGDPEEIGIYLLNPFSIQIIVYP